MNEYDRKAHAIAEFLTILTTPDEPVRVGEIAAERNCPIAPKWGWRGSEAHCALVKRSLQRAVKLGLIEEANPEFPRSGPIYYRPKAS